MQVFLKRVGYVAGGLIGVGLLAAAAVYLLSESRLNAAFEVAPDQIRFVSSADIIAEGEHLAVIRGCTDCHGPGLGGSAVIEDAVLGRIYAANLTAGEGGIGARYSDAELARAIRHGVARDGRGLFVMPSAEYAHLSDADVNALVAFIRSLPPVDQGVPPVRLTLFARLLFLTGQLPPLAAEIIDHQASRSAPPEPAADAAYGEYLAISCTGCHGPDYAGGPVPGAAPGSPESANLTPAGDLAAWNESGFILALRTGMTPDGQVLDPGAMPWPMTAQMTDLELKAIWAFLQTIPPVQ
jgi:mono/diheme cytochrome c family protein